ncbi:hypothetical protein [Bacillus sp. JJ722]|uniref:hypothetical protein n=1 Tax=Bacillus sp. JJ722 TaxID=3122973 RepID=UPI003000EF1B
MLTLIITLSIVLHCISIFAIIILYLRQNQYKETERKMESLRRDIDDIFQAYMVEMKEENKEIAATLATLHEGNQAPKESAVSKVSDSIHINENDKKVVPEIEANILVKPSKHAVVSAYNANKQLQAKYEPPYNEVKDKLSVTKTDLPQIVDEQKDQGAAFQSALKAQINKHKLNEGSKTTEEIILEMNNNGYGIEEIAKKLNRGKTEIELLLKFQTKPNS